MDDADRRLGYQLKQAQHALRRRMDDDLRPLGLTTPRYAALAALEIEPGLSNAALARHGFVTPQTMNAIVASLEAAGWAARSPDPANGRIIRRHLTDEGRNLLVAAHAVAANVEARMVRDLEPGQQEDLLHALRACARALGG